MNKGYEVHDNQLTITNPLEFYKCVERSAREPEELRHFYTLPISQGNKINIVLYGAKAVALEVGTTVNLAEPPNLQEVRQGYTMDNGVITIVDPLAFYMAEPQISAVSHKTTKFFQTRANPRDVSQAVMGMDDQLVVPSMGLTIDMTKAKLKVPPIKRYTPIQEVHIIYKRKCRELRAKMRSLHSLKLFEHIVGERDPALTMQHVMENPTPKNIANICRTASSWRHQYNDKPIPLADANSALNKAINAYRDEWLWANSGFLIKEVI